MQVCVHTHKKIYGGKGNAYGNLALISKRFSQLLFHVFPIYPFSKTRMARAALRPTLHDEEGAWRSDNHKGSRTPLSVLTSL